MSNSKRPNSSAKPRLAGTLILLATATTVLLIAKYSGLGPFRQPPGQQAKIEPPSAARSTPVVPQPKADSRPAPNKTGPAKTGPTNTAPVKKTAASDEAGRLRKVEGDVLVSPKGLRYERGSREGHRLKHVLRHLEDQPNRTGKHGVFHGDQATLIALIDEAFERARQRGPPSVVTQQQGQRTVFTVDMGRTIGFEGGQSGKRAGNPPARHIRLVLEDKSVITAFPLVAK